MGTSKNSVAVAKKCALLSAKAFLVLAAFLAGACEVKAQQPAGGTLPDAPAPKQDEVRPKQGTEGRPLKTTLEILGRRSAFFPDLAADRGPLSAGQKLELALDESVAPSRGMASAFTATISQARNDLPGYGQEWGGYAKRFGSSIGSGASSHFFGTFLLPTMLGQDPRYFVKLHGSTGSRVNYALERIFLTRTDKGKQTINWSGLLGGLLPEGLANSYLPDAERTTGKTFTRYGIRIGFSGVSNVVKEYWPTIFKSLRISKLVPSEQTDPGTVRPPNPSEPPRKPPE